MLMEPPQEFGEFQESCLFSVIVPIGPLAHKLENLKSWIPECPGDFELVLVVDEYGDRTFEILKQFLGSSAINAHTTLLRGRFNGPAEARNQGIRIARGKWIAFWDADDIPNIKAVKSVLTNTIGGPDVIVCGYQVMRGSSHVVRHTSSLKSLAYNPGLWRLVFCRNSIEGTYFPDLRLGEDQVFLAIVISKLLKIDFDSSIIYTYVVSQPDQLTSGTDNAPHLLRAANLIRVSNQRGIFQKIMEFRLRTTYIKRSLSGGHFPIFEFNWLHYFIVAFQIVSGLGTKINEK